MGLRLESGFRLDTSHFTLGRGRSFSLGEFLSLDTFRQACERVERLRQTGRLSLPNGEELAIGFPRLPHLLEEAPQVVEDIHQWALQLRTRYRHLLVLGIGGSSLGGQTLVHALGQTPPLTVHFEGDNLDPFSLTETLSRLRPEETAVLLISKSGTTVEPLAAFLHVRQWLGKPEPGQITAVTDPDKGLLRQWVREYGWLSFAIPPDVGGRWSVLSPVGLLVAEGAGHSAVELLQGAKRLDEELGKRRGEENPLEVYTALVHLAHLAGFHEAVIMPYTKRLYHFALWYVQLLSESLGKKYRRDGLYLPTGRTPIPALGTTDMHSQTQLHQEGPLNKVITFLELEDHGVDICLPEVEDLPEPQRLAFSGRSMAKILAAALDANRRALYEAGRPSLTVTLPRLNAFHLGELLYFFELTVALEGELLNVNAYDQPGVEEYKKYLKQWLGRR